MKTLPCAIFFILVHKLTDIVRTIVEKCIVLIFSHYLTSVSVYIVFDRYDVCSYVALF